MTLGRKGGTALTAFEREGHCMGSKPGLPGLVDGLLFLICSR